jgi:hypothetical protein
MFWIMVLLRGATWMHMIVPAIFSSRVALYTLTLHADRGTSMRSKV